MKCPKCGFNSFEFYDSCKKCSGDLTGYKQTHSITSIVLPQEAKEKLAAESRSSEGEAEHVIDTVEAHDDIFSFNLPEDSPAPPDHRNDDPFNFDEPSPGTKQENILKSDDDVFGDLLESTSQTEAPTFASGSSVSTSAVAKSADAKSGVGELDLESFSWDDTPVAGANETETADDFDSLFGEPKVNTQK
ncbi:MAG: hypothetical protein HGB32_11165 [Geobacteraceae bacterium]|nr:hypothetical protein [Geobacteraceae bacterium]NTW80694.1 hypothetical protein [Geobacteraceae bacterium]